MKKISFILTFLLTICLNVHSQSCVYKTNSTDKFTGITNMVLEPVLIQKKIKTDLMHLKNVEMILSKEGDNRYFTLSYTCVLSGPRFGGSGNKLICLLDNNTSVELPMAVLTSDVIKYVHSTKFSISEEVLQELLLHNITDIRCVSFVNPFDFSLVANVQTKPFFKCID